MTSTVLMHFHNEAYLLPWWLQHHRGVFDHGILIDYDSTDCSVAFCREFAPDWEVRRSRNRSFGACDVDAEIMDIERGTSGWKMATTTTEFILTSRPLQSILEVHPAMGLQTLSAVLVDPPTLIDIEPRNDLPLLCQRTYGYLDGDIASSRRRLIHPFPCGEYRTGRHSYQVAFEPVLEIATVWLQFTPMTKSGRKRKMQIAARIPDGDKRLGLGRHHYDINATEEGLWRGYRQSMDGVLDLSSVPWYAGMLDRLSRDAQCLK